MSNASPIVLITGAARGIGLATAQLFLQQGYHVIVTDKDTVEGQKQADALGEKAFFLPLDVASRTDFVAVVEQIEERWGAIDVLVNNAGIMRIGQFDQLSFDTEQQLLLINIAGVLNGMHAVLPLMSGRGQGQIINVASMAGRVAVPYGTVYSATKFAISGMTEAMRHEYWETGVLFSTIYPGIVQTSLSAGIRSPKLMPAVSPEDVAKGIWRAVDKRKRRVYVPRTGAVFAALPALLPDKIIRKLSDWTGLSTLFLDIDENQRTAYRQRVKKL